MPGTSGHDRQPSRNRATCDIRSISSTELLTPVTDHQEFPVRRDSMASAEAWGAALRMAPTWALASVVAWELPMLLQWGWPLAWRSLSP